VNLRGSCLDPVCLARLSRTWREWRTVDRLVGSKSVVLESPAITGKVPEQQPTKTPIARKPLYQPERGSSRVEAFKRRCPGEAERLSKSRNGDRSRGRDHDTSSTAASRIRSRAEDIKSETSRHHHATTSRSPRKTHRVAEERHGRQAIGWVPWWNVRLR